MPWHCVPEAWQLHGAVPDNDDYILIARQIIARLKGRYIPKQIKYSPFKFLSREI